MRKNKFLSKFIAFCTAVVVMAGVLPVSAFEFSDVAVTSPYKSSFDELYALGIINGYEDGTIRPDNNITRAEVTKMVVAAMGPSYTESAMGASGIDTEFYDVPGSHWAAGYVSTGVANGFINGNGDGTFEPEANVTYAQIVKMIVCAMGYNAICERNGGWPNGYLTVASSIGVTSGANIVGADTVVTRAQVAKLLNNALNIPIVDVTGYEESAYTGQLIAKTEIMDTINGYDASDYKTLLTKNHNTYKVKGRITATKRSDSALDADEVRFSVESTSNFDGVAYGSSYASATVERMKYSAGEASEYLFAYGEALIFVNSDNDYEILSFTPYGTNDYETTDTALFDEYVLSSGHIASIHMYVSDTSSKLKKYKMEDNFKVYVNGVEQSDEIDAIDDYLSGNDMGTVTFIDATETGKTSTNGLYDYVIITYYADAIVDAYADNGDELKIYFKDSSPDIRGTMKVDLEDEDISLSFICEGKEFDYTDLSQNDVLSIAYDVSGDFDESSFYDVYVSREYIDGRVDAERTDDSGRVLYTINGDEYAISSSMGGATLEIGTSYTLYLNAFGRVVRSDESSANSLVGILERVYRSADTDEYLIRLITNTGSKVTYTARDSAAFNRINTVFASMSGALEDRIVEYTINSNGYITSVEKVTAYRAVDAAYKESSNKLGKYSLSENTVVIDLTSQHNDVDTKNGISNVSRKSIDMFADNGEYDVVVAERSGSDATYRFVYVFGGSETYTADTSIAVFDSSTVVYDDYQGGRVMQLHVFEDGTETTLKVEGAYSPNLTRGDVFVYSTDSDGYVNEVVTIFESIGNAGADYETFLSAVMSSDYKNRENCDLYASFLNMPDGWENTTSATKTGKVDVVFGPIVARNSKNVTLARLDNSLQSSEIDDCYDYYITDDANIYIYDFSEGKAANRLSEGNIGSIIKTNIPNSCKTGSEKEIIDWKSVDREGNDINFLVAKVVDDDITEAMVILGKKDSYSSSLVSRYSVTSNENCTVSTSSARAGDTVTVSIADIPEGKVLDGIYVKYNSTETKLADGVTSFTMPSYNVVVETRFADAQYQLNIPAEISEFVSGTQDRYAVGALVNMSVQSQAGKNTVVTVTKQTGGSVEVSADGDAYQFTMPAENVNISVEYIDTVYQITATGCTITNAEGTPVTQAVPGAQLTIVPEPGKEPSSVTVNGNECTEMSFAMPEGDATVVVVYPAELATFSISTVDCITDVVTAVPGDTISVSYTEPENKVIEKITVNGLLIDNNQFTMPADDVLVVATFIDPLYNLTGVNCTLSTTSARVNDTVVVSYSIPEGKGLDKILVNGKAIAGNTFVMPAMNTVVEVVYTETSYNLTAENCSLSKSTAQYGDKITVSCVAPEGKVLDKITVNNQEISGTEFTMPECDVVVKAVFTDASYKITVPDGCTASKTVAKAGDSVSVASVNKDKIVESITVNGTKISGDTFTMPASDVVVTVTFSTKEYEIKAVGDCTVDKAKAVAGTTVNISCSKIPNGKIIDTFTVNGKAIKGSSFIVDSDAVVSVTFKDLKYAIIAEGCKTDKNEAAPGEKITVSYTVPEGKVFDKLTLNGTVLQGLVFNMPSQNSTVIASFKDKPVQVVQPSQDDKTVQEQ